MEDFEKLEFVMSEINSRILDELFVRPPSPSTSEYSNSKKFSRNTGASSVPIITGVTSTANVARPKKKRCNDNDAGAEFEMKMEKCSTSQKSEGKRLKKDKSQSKYNLRLLRTTRINSRVRPHSGESQKYPQKVERNSVSEDEKEAVAVPANSTCTTNIRQYLKRKTSLSNPHLNNQVRSDLIYMFEMRKKLVSHSISERELSIIFDKWFDTYGYRFYELHNVTKLSIAEIIHLFPGYGCFPLLKDDFLKDTKVDLGRLDEVVDWRGLIDKERNSQWAMQYPACSQAVELFDSTTEKSGLTKIVGMTLYVHRTLSIPELNHFVFHVTLSQIEDTSFGVQFVNPTIVIVGNESKFCTSTSENIYVYAGKVMICKADDFYNAVVTCYALYFVLWLKYDKNSERLFRAFDKLLNIPDTNF